MAQVAMSINSRTRYLLRQLYSQSTTGSDAHSATQAVLVERQRRVVHDHRHRLAVEVSAGEDVALLREDERVVRGRVQLHVQDGLGEPGKAPALAFPECQKRGEGH